MNGRIANGRAVREDRRRHRLGERECVGFEQTAKRIGQRLAEGDIVQAAGRHNRSCCVRRSTPELISAVGVDSKHRGVAIATPFAACLKGMLAADPLKTLPNLKKIAKSGDHRSPGDIERLVGTVAESQRRIRVVGRRELRCGARETDAGFHRECGRRRASPGDSGVALPIEKACGELRIDDRLAGIDDRPVHVGHSEAAEQARLVR